VPSSHFNVPQFYNALSTPLFLPVVYGSEQVDTGVTFSNSQGNVTFSNAIYFDSRNNTDTKMVFNVTTALHSNTNGQFTVTLTPSAGQQMQVSFIDTASNPLSVISGTVTSATWISGNSTLVVISATTQQTIVIGLQGKPSDTLNLTDIFAHGLGKYPSDILNVTDLIRKGTGKPLTDTLNLSDTILRLRNIPLSIGGAELNLSDFISKGVGKFSTEPLNIQESIQKSVGKPLSDMLNLIDSSLIASVHLTYNYHTTLSDTIAYLDSSAVSFVTITRHTSLTFSDILIVTDNLTSLYHAAGTSNIMVTLQEVSNLSDLLATLHVPVGINQGGGVFTTTSTIGPLLSVQLAAIPRIATLDYLTAYPLSFQTFLLTPTAIIQIVATGTNGNNAKQTINLWYNVTGAQTLTTPKEQHVLNSGVPTTFSSWIPVTKTGTYTIVPQAEGTNTATLPTQTVTVGWLDLYLVSIILWLTIATPIAIITYMAVNTIRTRREEAEKAEES